MNAFYSDGWILSTVHVHNKCNIHIIYSNILNFESFSAEKLFMELFVEPAHLSAVFAPRGENKQSCCREEKRN